MNAVVEAAPELGARATCNAFGVARATYYRKRSPMHGPRVARPSPSRRLSDTERAEVLDVLHEPRFADLAPAQVHSMLLHEKRYLCSLRTMHRVLAENAEVRERRDVLRHPRYSAPQLLATRPNELWSWDITKLLGPAKWTYYYLYVVLDVFSRYVVGWMVAHRESAALACKLIEESCVRQGISPGQLTLHADRGSSMTSKSVAFLLADLGVTKTHSRPHVSNDNPLQRVAVQDAQVPAGLSRALRQRRARTLAQRRSARLVQLRPPPQRPGDADARGRPLRPRAAAARRATGRARRSVRGTPRAFCATPARRSAADRSLDKQARRFGHTRNHEQLAHRACSLNFKIECLKIVDTFRAGCAAAGTLDFMSSSERSGRRAAKAVAIAALALGLGFLAGQRLRPAPPVPVLAPNERLADTPAVLVAVRGLARLESVSFHMERIIDLENRQPRLFGLLEAKDAILLVAVGEVTAGIDLAKLRDGDVIADPVQRRISLRLPPPEILSVRLDNERTYAHERKTDALARRADDIETRARRIAESSIRGAALDSGILARAKESAEHTLTVLVRSLGYDRVQITWSEP